MAGTCWPVVGAGGWGQWLGLWEWLAYGCCHCGSFVIVAVVYHCDPAVIVVPSVELVVDVLAVAAVSQAFDAPSPDAVALVLARHRAVAAGTEPTVVEGEAGEAEVLAVLRLSLAVEHCMVDGWAHGPLVSKAIQQLPLLPELLYLKLLKKWLLPQQLDELFELLLFDLFVQGQEVGLPLTLEVFAAMPHTSSVFHSPKFESPVRASLAVYLLSNVPAAKVLLEGVLLVELVLALLSQLDELERANFHSNWTLLQIYWIEPNAELNQTLVRVEVVVEVVALVLISVVVQK